MVDRTFDWKRVDLNKVVYAYRHKQENPNDQMAHYRGRTTVNLDDLSRGNMTLQISSVQLADTGPYSCFVPKLETSCVTDLTVVEQVTSTTRPPPDEPSNPGKLLYDEILLFFIGYLSFSIFVNVPFKFEQISHKLIAICG